MKFRNYIHRVSMCRHNVLIKVFAGIFILLSAFKINAEGFSPFITNETYQPYINYLIASDKLHIDHPLNQPYQANDISNNDLISEYDNDDYWQNLLNLYISRLRHHDGNSKNIKVNIDGSYSLNALADSLSYYNGSFALKYYWENIGINYQYNADKRYQEDSEFFGAIGKFGQNIYARTSEAYIQWQNSNHEIFFGRMKRNFGLAVTPGLLISDNPNSYDHISYTFQNDFLRFQTMFSRLNDIYGYDIRDTITTYEWQTRFLSVHRLELSLFKNLEIAFSECMLFGGSDDFPQLQYLNPANIFFSSKMGERRSYDEDEANALMGFEIYYKPLSKLTLYSQFLVDDIDFTQSLREIYPDRLGLTLKAMYADLIPASLVSLTYNRISNWTYNSFYTFGNYTFNGKSLGYPLHGAENIEFDLQYFGMDQFIFDFNLKSERRRAQDLYEAFIGEKTEFPIGIPEEIISVGIGALWMPNIFMFLNFELSYNYIYNYNNIEYNKMDYITIRLEAKIDGIFDLIK